MSSLEEQISKLEEHVYSKKKSWWSWWACDSERNKLLDNIRQNLKTIEEHIENKQREEKIRQDARATFDEIWQKVQQERDVTSTKCRELINEINNTGEEFTSVVLKMEHFKDTIRQTKGRIEIYQRELVKGDNPAYYQSLLDDHTDRLEYYEENLAKLLEMEKTLQERKEKYKELLAKNSNLSVIS